MVTKKLKLRNAAADKFAEINKAYDILTDPVKRCMIGDNNNTDLPVPTLGMNQQFVKVLVYILSISLTD